jgi:ATP-dependent DNA ligase
MPIQYIRPSILGELRDPFDCDEQAVKALVTAGAFVALEHACKFGCEGIVSKRRGSRYARGRSSNWLKVKNPDAPAVRREREEHWGG